MLAYSCALVSNNACDRLCDRLCGCLCSCCVSEQQVVPQTRRSRNLEVAKILYKAQQRSDNTHAAADTEHTRADLCEVNTGETLGAIALRHGVRKEDLLKWNNLLTSDLRAGQRLRLQPPEQPMLMSASAPRTPQLLAPLVAQAANGDARVGASGPTLSEEDKVDLLRAARPAMSTGALRALLRQTDGNVDRALTLV